MRSAPGILFGRTGRLPVIAPAPFEGRPCFLDGRQMGTLNRTDIEGMIAAGGVLLLNGAELTGADLDGLALAGADLSYARLEGASLRGADLGGAKLWAVRAHGADFSGAVLRDAQLGTADLSAANLQRADLRRARLGGCNLRQADLRGADLRETTPDPSCARARSTMPARAGPGRPDCPTKSISSGSCACVRAQRGRGRWRGGGARSMDRWRQAPFGPDTSCHSRVNHPLARLASR